MFDALARQIVRQRLAAACLRRRLESLRQSRVRHGDRLVVVPAFSGGLLGFVEDALRELFALRRVAVQAFQAQLLLKTQDALREFLVLGLQRRDLGRARRDQCFQLVRCGLATHRILESKSCSRVNRVPMFWRRHPKKLAPMTPPASNTVSPRSDIAAPDGDAPPRYRCRQAASAAPPSSASAPPPGFRASGICPPPAASAASKIPTDHKSAA